MVHTFRPLLFLAVSYTHLDVYKRQAEMKAEEQAKDLQVLQEENNRLRNEIKVLQEYKEKAYRELCQMCIRDSLHTSWKI